MGFFSDLLLFNALAAAAAALVVSVVGFRAKNPRVMHTLWLLVLLKLVTPPLFTVDVIPDISGVMTAPVQQVSVTTEMIETTSGQPPRPSLRDKVARPGRQSVVAVTSRTLPVLALTGLFVVLGIAVFRTVRFRRCLHGCPSPPTAMIALVERVGWWIGVEPPSRVYVVPGCISPSLWPRLPRPEVLLPQELLLHLSDTECEALVAHELAHARYHHHWIRPLELIVIGLYWWHPAMWWARSQLRLAEERMCDAEVASKLPWLRRDYAESLLKTAEFLSTGKVTVPALATGAAHTNRLKERINMIFRDSPSNRLPSHIRTMLIVTMLLVVTISPKWMSGAATSAVTGARSDQQINRVEIAMQKKLHEIEMQRRAVQRQADEARSAKDLECMLEEIDRLEKVGETEQAEMVRAAVNRLQARIALHRKTATEEAHYSDRQATLEFELADLELQLEEARSLRDDKRADALRFRARQLRVEIRELALKMLEASIDRSAELLRQEKEDLEVIRGGQY